MVVADRALTDDRFALGERPPALLRVLRRFGESAQDVWAVEPEPGFTTNGHGFLEKLEGLPAPAFGLHRLAQVEQTALHEAMRAKAVHDRPGLLDLILQAGKSPSANVAKTPATRALSSAR
jgi:hypothetical protein